MHCTILTSHRHLQTGMFLACGLHGARTCKVARLNFVFGVPFIFPFTHLGSRMLLGSLIRISSDLGTVMCYGLVVSSLMSRGNVALSTHQNKKK